MNLQTWHADKARSKQTMGHSVARRKSYIALSVARSLHLHLNMIMAAGKRMSCPQPIFLSGHTMTF